MKENIVYLLGAGFSAPLGLPVMTNFLFKSRDQYFEESTKYGYFQDVFELIRSLSDIKNYFRTDLFNIEEILSIFEMQRHLGRGETEAHDYIKYLCDVIEYHTPKFVSAHGTTANWYDVWLGDEKARPFGYFVACLFNLTVKDIHGASPLQRLVASREAGSSTSYSVVTLNYDLVLENLRDEVCSSTQIEVDFCKDPSGLDRAWINAPYLAKLHGTVASGKVVPPTWNKGLHPEIVEVWRLAYNLLSTATQIRVLGYSLPESDAYVKYLLKAAVSEAKNLRQIDVICLDPSGHVKDRYDAFIDFPNYRFASLDVLKYLGHSFTRTQMGKPVQFNFLEKLHQKVAW